MGDTAAILLSPLDRIRRGALAALGPLARPFLTSREIRVAAAGSMIVVTALLGASLVPFWMLALGPVLLGVPHLVADVRYLVVRPGYHRRPALWFAIGVPLAAAAAGAGVLAGLAAAAGALFVARGSRGRRWMGLAVVGGLAFAAWRAGPLADLVFAHAHNFIAIALWWAWRPRDGHLHWIPLALFVAASALLMAGLSEPLLALAGGLVSEPNGVPAELHLASLAPGVNGALGLRLVLLFAFAQSVHYGIWLRLVPEEDRARKTPRTFAASARALRDDLGGWGFGIAIAVALGVALWALVDLASAHQGYFRLALFHAPLELGVAALFWMEGRPR